MTVASSSGRKKDSARLIWDTKPRRAANPKDIDFQTAELVVPNPAREQSLLSSFTPMLERGEIEKSQMNRLIWGDNLLALQALLASGYEGKVDLIYIDPPFWTGENYYANIPVGNETITKSPSVIERIAYKDYWEGGIDSYLDMLYPRIQLMRRLLPDSGMMYVHTDPHVGHYVKVILDEIFGYECFVNEIIWKRFFFHADARRFGRVADRILLYSKTKGYKFNRQFAPYKKEYVDAKFTHEDERGSFRLDNLNPPAGRDPSTNFTE